MTLEGLNRDALYVSRHVCMPDSAKLKDNVAICQPRTYFTMCFVFD